jgi:hypothetical protein
MKQDECETILMKGKLNMHSEILVRCRWCPGSDVREFFSKLGGYVREDHRDLRRQGPTGKRGWSEE